MLRAGAIGMHARLGRLRDELLSNSLSISRGVGLLQGCGEPSGCRA